MEYLVTLGGPLLYSGLHLIYELCLNSWRVLSGVPIPLQHLLIENIIGRVEPLDLAITKFLQPLCLLNDLCSLLQVEETLGLKSRLACPVCLLRAAEERPGLWRVSETISIVL